MFKRKALRTVFCVFFGGVLLMNAAAGDRDESGELRRPEDDRWLEWTSIDDVLEHRPERIDLLLNALDMEHKGLEPVREAVESGDKKAACRALLDYFEKEGREEWVYERLAEPAESHIEKANYILEDRFAEWAGHLTSRNGWEEGALWSFFNVGPTGYPHREHLHLSLTAYGKDFLVNSGRFWYNDDKWKRFSRSTRSSNVVLIDGREQKLKPRTVKDPLADHLWSLTEEFDFAEGTHTYDQDMQGDASHTRAVVFLREVGAWIVVDRISTDRPRSITPMWRFRPERTVAIKNGQTLVTEDEEGANLSIVPAGGPEWEVELIRGQEEPYVQGWYSPRTTEWEPNTCAEFHGDIGGDADFAWIMTPFASEARQPEVEVPESPEGVMRLDIRWPDGPERTVTVVLDDSVLPIELEGGRRLLGKLLIEAPEEAPRVGSGVLLNSEGEIIAEDDVKPGSFLDSSFTPDSR